MLEVCSDTKEVKLTFLHPHIPSNLFKYPETQNIHTIPMDDIIRRPKDKKWSCVLFDRLEPIMLKNLPIIPSRTFQKFYPLFLIYSQIITYYSFIILLILLSQ